MGNLFGIRRRAPQVTDQDRAILQLKQQRDKIKIYQKKTELDLEKNQEIAIRLFQDGKKDRALVVMRRKKCMEDVLSRTDKQLEVLEQLVSDIEYTQVEVSVVEGLRVGTEALKQLNNLMNIEDIQQMMEDNAEAAAKQKEISDILEHSAERYDEDELLRELEKYKEEPETPLTDQKDEDIVHGETLGDLPRPTESDLPDEAAEHEVAADLDEINLDSLPKVPEEKTAKKAKVEERQLEQAQ